MQKIVSKAAILPNKDSKTVKMPKQDSMQPSELFLEVILGKYFIVSKYHFCI